VNELARREHQSSATHARNLQDEDLPHIPIELHSAFPEDLACKNEYVKQFAQRTGVVVLINLSRRQRVDIYTQKGCHHAAVGAMLEERDRLERGLEFKTLRKQPDTNPITPLPPLFTAASPFDDTRSSIEQSPSPSISSTRSTLPPSTPSPPMSRACSPARHTLAEQTGLFPGHKYPTHFMFNPSQVLGDSVKRSGPGCNPKLTGSFPAHVLQQFEHEPPADAPPRLLRLISASIKQQN
jgi:hypothetical protein